MKLGKYFTLAELTATSTGLPNEPRANDINSLKALVENVLDPARALFEGPIIVNSGYRSKEVNSHKNVKGSPTSQHLKGEAADLKSTDNAKLFNIIRKYCVFDQLIWEGGNDKQPDWVHVSYKSQGNRGEVLQMKVVNGKKTYIRI